jgi:hypothetical protein
LSIARRNFFKVFTISFYYLHNYKENQWRFFKFILIIPFGCHGNQISAWNEILWTTLEALHPRINPAKFGWNWTSGFSQDFLSSLYNLYNTQTYKHTHTYTQVNRYMPPHRRCCGGIKSIMISIYFFLWQEVIVVNKSQVQGGIILEKVTLWTLSHVCNDKKYIFKD